MITLTINVENAAELKTTIEGLANIGITQASVAALATAPAPDAEAPKATRKRAEPKADAEPAAPEAKAEAPTPEPEKQPEVAEAAGETTAEVIDYALVRAAILKVSAEKGREAAAAVLEGLGVAKGPDLKPEQYAPALAALEAKLAA